ncbi:MAG TPA: zinc ribbon domain-containing protein [Candidatus Acidoferrum sp.]|nr:zinc ribbon domain-containing protein [Candidatus Acidoferrum sp.]
MFCDGCGATLNPGAEFCSICGKRVIPAPVPAPGYAPGQFVARPSSMDRVKRNLSALTILWMVYGILRAVGVVWLLGFGRAFVPWILGNMGGHDMPMFGNWGLGSLISMGMYTAGILAVAFAAAYLLLAWGLYEKRPWARILGIVLGFLVLLRIPFGTALGIYTLWVLLPGTSGQEYDQIAQA